MRIRRIQLVGLAAVLAGGATNALAQDLVVANTGHAPVNTSSPTGGTPGDVTINSGGSIVIPAINTAGVTVDSNNDVTVNSGGTISSNNLNDTTGIHILTGNTGIISNAGTISLLEDHTLTDGDNDGDLDGEFAEAGSMHRYGILLDAGTHSGDITSSGTIQVEGNLSGGIVLNGFLSGNLTTGGTMSVTGEDSVGILIGAGISGDANLRGNVTVLGQNDIGLAVNGDIGGTLRLSGNWTGAGYLSTIPPLDQTHLEASDIEQSGALISVLADVDNGIVVEGVGVEDDTDDNGDGITEAAGDTNDDASATLQIYGSAPAVSIGSTASGNVIIGASSFGYGFVNRGRIFADGVYNNKEATGIQVSGTGTTTVTLTNGFENDNFIIVNTSEANVYGVHIGQNAIVPIVLNRNTIGATMTGADADLAYALYIDGGTVPAFNNSGSLSAVVRGENGDAIAIYDASGTLSSITNSGSIFARVLPFTGTASAGADAIAMNLSANSTGVTITQNPDVPFTDQDSNDDDVTVRPGVAILGDILLGSGADTITLNAGLVTGDISFGLGADVFNINGGATYTGIISDNAITPALSINVNDGLLSLRGGHTQLSNATFGNDGQLRVLLSGNTLDPPVLDASGTITFAPGTILSINVPSGLPESDTQVFLTAAGGLSGWSTNSNILGPVTGGGTPFLYDLTVALTNPMAADGAPNGLEATYQIKSATALGLSANQGNALEAVIEALRTSTAAGDAVLALDNQDDFLRAYAQLMPNYSSGATELAATAIQQMQSATSNRLAATRLHGLNEVSTWGQEIGYGLTRTPPNANGLEFRGSGFGFAAGIDGPLDNGALFGLSASFLASQTEEPARSDGEIAASFGQVNAYLGTAMSVFDLDFVLGLGAGKMKSRRFVQVGDSFSAVAEADWWGYEAHGAARASLPLTMGNWLVITPQAQLTYVGLNEQDYAEEGGGTAIDYNVDSAFSQRLWGDVGVEFSGNWHFRGDTVVAPRVYLGYRANVLNDEAERNFRFVSGGPQFTLTDENVGNGGPLVGIGIDATNGYSTFSLSYEGEFSDQIERHSLNAAVRFRF